MADRPATFGLSLGHVELSLAFPRQCCINLLIATIRDKIGKPRMRLSGRCQGRKREWLDLASDGQSTKTQIIGGDNHASLQCVEETCFYINKKSVSFSIMSPSIRAREYTLEMEYWLKEDGYKKVLNQIRTFNGSCREVELALVNNRYDHLISHFNSMQDASPNLHTFES
ncbi:hypothetical protein NC651_004756 [Populus alba x Populus x berolinensis]|nr:hypothetical protein NC651_004756 [Populus alba x Populus x berolinensis]